MNNIIEKFKKIIIIISILFFIIIFYNALLYTDKSFYINSITKHSEYIYWGLSFILFSFLLAIFKCIDKWDNKKKTFFIVAILSILFIVQFILLIDVKTTQVTDPYLINDQARAIVLGIDKIVDYNSSNYFLQYSNNNFCLLLVIMITKLFKFLHINLFNNYLVLFNIFMIDLSIILSYKYAKRLKNKEFAIKVLLLNVLNPLNYLFIHWTYTCTYFAPFMVGILYLYNKISDSKKIDMKYTILTIIFGIVSVIGYFLRPIIVIPLIAIFIVVIINLISNYKVIKERISSNYKKIIIVVFAFLFSVLTCYKVVSYYSNKYSPDKSRNFPVTHWIMMGIHGEGMVNEVDNNFTFKYKTKKEKINANIWEIKRTLLDYGVTGLVNHLVIKLPVTWSDGISEYYFRSGNIINNSYTYNYIYGEKKDFVVVYCQSFRILTIFLLILSLFNQLKKKSDYRFIFSLTLFGGVLFYLLWEAKNAYSYPFITLIIFLCCDALNNISLKSLINSNIKIKYCGYLCIFFTILTFVSLDNGFTENVSTWYKYRLSSQSDLRLYVDDLAKNNRTIRQDFYVDGKFNYINLSVMTNEDNSIDTKYNIKIIKGKKTIKDIIVGKDNLYKNKLYIGVSELNNNMNKKYSIVISPTTNYKNKKDSIYWGYGLLKATDCYKGDLFLDNKLINSDLSMNVYYGKDEIFINKYIYYAVMIIIVSFELLIISILKNVKD